MAEFEGFTDEIEPEPQTQNGKCVICGKNSIEHFEDELLECLSELGIQDDELPTCLVSDAMKLASRNGISIRCRQDKDLYYVGLNANEIMETRTPAAMICTLILENARPR
jgi:hypothetical protein